MRVVASPSHLAGFVRADRLPAAQPDDKVNLSWAEPDTDLEVQAWQFGDLDFCLFTGAGAVEVAPDRSMLAASPGLAIGMCLGGRVSLTQAGRTARLVNGDFTFYRGGEPYQISAPGPHQWLVVRLRFLRLGPDAAALTGLLAGTFPRSDVLVGLLSTALRSLPSREQTLGGRAELLCADAIRSLTAAVVEEAIASTSKGPAPSLFATMTQWLEGHLADPAVNAEAVARAHHVSSRYVRKLFAQHQTSVSAFVRDRRLEHLRQDLLDPTRTAQTVAMLARRWGMPDVVGATKAFRGRYGLPPATYRRLAVHHGFGPDA